MIGDDAAVDVRGALAVPRGGSRGEGEMGPR